MSFRIVLAGLFFLLPFSFAERFADQFTPSMRIDRSAGQERLDQFRIEILRELKPVGEISLAEDLARDVVRTTAIRNEPYLEWYLRETGSSGPETVQRFIEEELAKARQEVTTQQTAETMRRFVARVPKTINDGIGYALGDSQVLFRFSPGFTAGRLSEFRTGWSRVLDPTPVGAVLLSITAACDADCGMGALKDLLSFGRSGLINAATIDRILKRSDFGSKDSRRVVHYSNPNGNFETAVAYLLGLAAGGATYPVAVVTPYGLGETTVPTTPIETESNSGRVEVISSSKAAMEVDSPAGLILDPQRYGLRLMSAGEVEGLVGYRPGEELFHFGVPFRIDQVYGPGYEAQVRDGGGPYWAILVTFYEPHRVSLSKIYWRRSPRYDTGFFEHEYSCSSEPDPRWSSGGELRHLESENVGRGRRACSDAYSSYKWR